MVSCNLSLHFNNSYKHEVNIKGYFVIWIQAQYFLGKNILQMELCTPHHLTSGGAGALEMHRLICGFGGQMARFHNFSTLARWLTGISEALPEKQLVEKDICWGCP